MSQTAQVEVSVVSQFVAHQSAPANNEYVFAYTITLKNHGSHTVQLRERYWLITNGNGEETEVQGEGVVGEQPILVPGGEYQYTSGAVLETPIGTMQGHYLMETTQGDTFYVDIPLFQLADQRLLH